MQDPEHLILKHLSQTTTPEEENMLQRWADASLENRERLKQMKRIWESGTRSVEGFDFQTNEEWSKLDRSLTNEIPRGKQVSLSRQLLRIAASVIIVAGISAVIHFSLRSNETLITSGDSMITYYLSDSSKVELNEGSEIRFDEAYNKEFRTVRLSGEAFFDVRRNPDKPFVVITGNTEVKVLGTSFTIRSYPNDDQQEVFVVTGAVEMKSVITKQAIRLHPGDKGTLSVQTGELTAEPDETGNALAWSKKRLIFKNSTMSTVTKDVARYFKIDIEVRNPKLLACRFTSSFQNPKLEEVLEALSLSLGVTIEKEGLRYIFNGDGC